MKDPKVYRLVLGLVILFSIFLFQGSDDHGELCAEICLEDLTNVGYIEIHNHTLWDILAVIVYPNKKGAETFEIKGDPNFIRKMVTLGRYTIITYILEPFTRKMIIHRTYYAYIEKDGGKTVINVTGGSIF